MKTSKKPALLSFIQFIIKAFLCLQIIVLALFTLNAFVESYAWISPMKESEILDVHITGGKYMLVKSIDNAKMSKDASLYLSSGTLKFQKAGERSFMISKLFFIWITYAIGMSITLLLIKVFKNVGLERPFVKENAFYLRAIAFLIMALPIVTFLQGWFINEFIKKHFLLEGSQIRSLLTIDVKTIFLA